MGRSRSSYCQYHTADGNRGAGEGRFLTENSIKALPCEELNAVDSLWTHHSNGLFGFSVQVEIWKSLGSPRNLNSPIDIRAMDSFCHQVGWSSGKDLSEILDTRLFPCDLWYKDER